MTYCKCSDILDKTIICEFCTEMLWAAKFEEDLKEFVANNYVSEKDLDEYITEDSLERDYLHGYVKEDDLENELERYMNDANIIDKDELDSYVAKDDLEDTIEEVLNESDIVKEVASGAIHGVLKILVQYAQVGTVNELESRIRTLENTIEKLNSKLEDKSKPSLISRFVHFLTYNQHGE